MGKTKKNILLQITYQIFGMLVPFITAPYVLRVLGAEQVGIYSYTHSIVNYFMCFSLLGLEFHGNRSIASVRENKGEVNRVFSEVFFCHLISAAISIIAYVIYCFTLTGIYRIIGFIQLLYLIGEMMNVNWFFAGIGEFKVTVLRHILVKILNITLIFTMVKSEDDLLKYIFIMALCTCTSMCSVWVVLWKYVKFVKVSMRAVLQHLKPLCLLFVSVLAINLNQMLDKTMLGFFKEFSMLGCYEYADKFINIPITLVTALGTVMLSKSAGSDVAESKEKTRILLCRVLEYVTLLSSLVIFGILLYRELFVELYFGKQFDDVALLFGILSISFLFIAWNSVLRTQYFIPQKLDKYYLISVWIGAGLNIVLNAMLIPSFSAVGAAVATDISYGVIILVQMIFICKEVSFWNLCKRCIPLAFIGFVPFVLLLPLYKHMQNGWVTFLIQVLLFCIVFLGVTLVYWKVTKNPILAKRKK